MSIEWNDDLTDREQEIFNLVILGCYNEEIAERLFITPNTVKQHIFNIMQKCGIRDRMTMTLLHYGLPTWMDAVDEIND